MKQKEVLLLERGQIKLHRDFPKIIDVLKRENIDLLFVLSEFIAMPKQTRLQEINVSYFTDDIFKNMTEEKLVSETKPIEMFRHALEMMRRKHPEIVRSVITYENGCINFHVFIKEPNWDLEELIYIVYGDLLEKFPTQPFNLQVTELFK